MDKLDEKSAERFINALVKSVQVLCHGYLNFHNGIEIIGHINLSVDKESSLHYILEEKVCKSEENSTMFISNSFYAQKAELQAKEKGCENVHSLTGRINLNEMSNASLIISTCGSSSSSLRDKSHSASTSSASEAVSPPCKTASSPAKRKASSDCDSVKSKTKSSSYVSPGSERFAAQSPHKPASVSSLPEDTKPSLKDLTRNEELSEDSLSLPNVRDIVNNLGVDLVGSVLEPVSSERTRSDCSDKHDESDGDVEVTFIKKEFPEDSAYLPDNSCRFQYGRGTPQKGSSSGKVEESSVYPDPHAHATAASATYVSSASSDLDAAGAPLHGLSTSASQPHQRISFSPEFCQAVHSSASASATFVPSAHGHDVTSAELYGPSTSSHQGVSFSAGTGSQNGVSGQLGHSSRGGFMVGEASYTPPLAHHAHSSVAHPALGLSVLDLSIKAEPRDPDFVLFDCEPRRKKNSVLFRPRAGSRSEESRQKAKEKSKEYRMKQKIHRMTDSTYDMIFRHRVAERKRRQRMRDRIKKLKLHGVADFSIAK